MLLEEETNLVYRLAFLRSASSTAGVQPVMPAAGNCLLGLARLPAGNAVGGGKLPVSGDNAEPTGRATNLTISTGWAVVRYKFSARLGEMRGQLGGVLNNALEEGLGGMSAVTIGRQAQVLGELRGIAEAV